MRQAVMQPPMKQKRARAPMVPTRATVLGCQVFGGGDGSRRCRFGMVVLGGRKAFGKELASSREVRGRRDLPWRL